MTDERITAYLLEELTEEESGRFEDECFASEDWPGHLALVEEELIEDYLRGELAPERRLRFEHNYLRTTPRMERVRLAAALLRHVDEQTNEQEADERPPSEEATGIVPPEPRKPRGWFSTFWLSPAWAPRVAVALAALALLVGTWWWARPRTDLPPTVATLTLPVSYSDRSEGAQSGRVRLPPGAAALNISLVLPDRRPPAARYRAELEDARGEKKTVEVTGGDARSVTVSIPAPQLASGRYALKLFAVQSDGTEQRIPGSYFFNVD